MTFNLSQEMWRRTRLGDIVRINNKSIDRTFTAKEIEYHDTSSVYKNIFSEPQVIKLKDAPSRARRLVQDGDVIISTVRPNQEHIGLIEKPKENTVVSTGFAVITPISIDSKFLFYYLSQPRIVTYLTAIAETSTSTFPAIRPEILEDLLVTIPAQIEEQKRIGDILYLYDQKIDLNRQTNATLEAIAQAIFKEWFVDFNYPGATGEMVDSPLGPIPKGWRVGILGELCKITMGQSPPGDSYNEDGHGVPFFQGRSDFGFRFPTKRMFTTNPKRFAEKSNTLVSVRAPVGDMNVALENCCIGRGVAAVIERGGNSTFTYYYLNHLTEHFKSFEDNGTVFGSITKKDFESIQCVIPPTKLISLFESTSHIFDELILNNHLEEENLKIIRDSILPRLMNGRIEV
jgi:type I restriction enzyme S subunit